SILFSIPAVKAIEFGSGIDISSMTGSNANEVNSNSANEIGDENNSTINKSEKDILLKQADILSEHLVQYSISSYLYLEKSNIKRDCIITEVSDMDIFRFISTVFIYSSDTIHPYKHIAKIDDPAKGYVSYTLKDAQSVTEELFDRSDWFFDQNFDTIENAYIIPTAAGFGNNLTITDVNSFWLNDGYSIQTEVSIATGYIGEEPYEKIGDLIVAFDVIEGNGKIFLRLSSIQTK
ncbi:MAG: hypothetical protein RSA20_03665, partial [Oscillospiraceae bacterium]